MSHKERLIKAVENAQAVLRGSEWPIITGNHKEDALHTYPKRLELVGQKLDNIKDMIEAMP